MAIHFARRVRPLLVIASLGATALLAPTLASAAPSTAPRTAPHRDPSVSDVQKQLGQLALQNSQLVERFDHARVLVTKREKVAKVAHGAARSANADYEASSVEYARILQAQYEGGSSFGVASALLDSNSDNNYLARIDTMNLMSAHDADVINAMKSAKLKATSESRRAASLLAEATKERDALGEKKAAVEKQIAKYQDLLSTLTSAEQSAYQRAANPSVSDAKVNHLRGKLPAAGSPAAKRAVQFAINQVGKPYVFGAAGPGSYDCSGLTMSAWQHGGVSLPHSAADQYNYGHHVDRSELSPGDLIFFYQPIGHVTIYVGNGMMVSAPTEGQPVAVVPLNAYNGDYTGATRVG